MTAIPFAPARPSSAPLPEFGRDLDSSPTHPMPTVIQAPARLDARVRVLLVEELEQVTAHVGSLLADDGQMDLVETVTDGAMVVGRVEMVAPDVIIIDALMQGQVSGIQAARDIRAAGVTTPITFLTVKDRPITLASEMGISAVVTLPLDGATLRSTITRLDDEHRGPVMVPPSGTLAVFSSKGGAGRTTIAHNLAAALGQRPGTRAVLVDGDLIHGDLRVHLGAPGDAPSVLQLPTDRVRDEDVAPLLWTAPSGVEVLLAPEHMHEAELVTKRDMENALTVLGAMYDVVVIDMPAVPNDISLAMLDRSDLIIDLVTLERDALRKAQRTRAALLAAGFAPQRIATVVNRDTAPGSSRATVQAALGDEPVATLHLEPVLVSEQLSDGMAIVLTDPQATLSADIAGLVEALVARLQGSPVMGIAEAA